MTPEDLAKHVRLLNLRTRRLVDGVFAGEYHSVFKGRGVEFAEVREYVPGDDIRTIDWNVTARMGEPYVKIYVEERELTVLLVIDASASENFTSVGQSKADLAARIAAVLGVSALRNNDRAGVLFFTDRVEKLVPPIKGKHAGRRLIRELLVFEPESPGTDIAAALGYLHTVMRQRALCFLISDFLGGDFERALRQAHQRHEIVPVWIYDPREHELPPVGLVRVQDPETGATHVIDTDSDAVRTAFRRRREQARQRQRRVFQSLGIDFVEVGTDEAFVPCLMQFFRRRERRLAQGR